MKRALIRFTILLCLSAGISLPAQTNISVVFHVVYNTASQNIPDSCLQQQLDVLNEDFNAANSDLWKVPSAWVPIIGNMNVHFQLATIDPSGNPTTGIERRQYPAVSWTTNDNVKHLSTGGMDAWPDTTYLNIWVCNLSNGLMGYTQFPGGPVATDGVVLHFQIVGRGTYSLSPFNLGRVGTHEVGHYFGLKHFGPDPNCVDIDNIPDTPAFSSSIYGGFSSFQVVTDACNPSSPGIMWMNFMTYVDDSSMYFFTQNQVDTMNWVLANMRLGHPNSISTIANSTSFFSIFPSPSLDGQFNFNYASAESKYVIEIYNSLGESLERIPSDNSRTSLDLSTLPSGIYSVVLIDDRKLINKRISIVR